MKNLYILILAFLSQATSVFAQSGWQSQTSGTNVRLRSVHFTSSSTGWVAGNFGTILRTTDGGDNWSAQSSGTTVDLISVHFPTSSIGYASGSNGVIIKTTNGGDNWFTQTSGTTQNLSSIFFRSTTEGWAVGGTGTILRTANGGTNWNPQSSGTTEYLFSSSFPSSTTGWAVGGSPVTETIILKTTNTGINWFPQSTYAAGLLSVHFASATTGCAVGTFGQVRFTTDGGENWEDPGFIPLSSGLNSVHLFSGTTGWIATGSGKVLKTTTGGREWFIQETGNSNGLDDIYFTSSTIGWAVGNNGTIIKTTNGGTSTFHLNLSVLLEGLYDINSGVMKGDTITVAPLFVAPNAQPTQPSKGLLDSTGHCTLTFFDADHSTPFYLYVNHRNSIETWTSNTMMFSSFALNYDFTTAASQAAGNNMVLKGAKYCIYSGDVNQDDAVDVNDAALVDNDLYIFAAGSYLITDLNGDEIVDVSDAVLVDNNAFNFVEVIYPWSMRTH